MKATIYFYNMCNKTEQLEIYMNSARQYSYS